MMILSELEKTMYNHIEVTDGNETDADCRLCRCYYKASDEDITRCHYCGLTEKMPCFRSAEK